jgi:flagellar hook protein FlgE
MFTSFSTALSALSAQSTAVDVVGNNLANLNTPGFKTSVVYFRDLVTQSLGAGLGETQVGFGTGRPLTIRQFSQGAIQASTGLLDAAIQGDGFFVVKNDQGNTLYTRAGNFQVDLSGRMLTNTGERVQGWTTVDPITGAVNTNGPTSDIVLPLGSLNPPAATTLMTVDLNLDASTAEGIPSRFSTPMEVFDSLGAAHVLTIHFEKTAPNTWNYEITIPGAEVSGGVPGEPSPVSGGSGTLTFDSNGQLVDPPPGVSVVLDITGLESGASDMQVTWDLYNPNGTPRITQFGQPSAVSANDQNGFPPAQLIRVGLSDGGCVLAQYSNGQQAMVGQVAMAAIRNPDTLIAVGNNNFQLSARSATPAIGVAGTGGRGTILGGAIEFSTVDIAREFTNLIVLQRGYQANSRVITTVDELSQETINLKR